MPALSASATDVINQVAQFEHLPMGVLQIAAQIVLDVAQANCPVDTGYLRDSAFMQALASDVFFGFNAEYASYVEFGTYKMAAQPYLRPALDMAENDAYAAIVDAVYARMKDVIG